MSLEPWTMTLEPPSKPTQTDPKLVNLLTNLTTRHDLACHGPMARGVLFTRTPTTNIYDTSFRSIFCTNKGCSTRFRQAARIDVVLLPRGYQNGY